MININMIFSKLYTNSINQIMQNEVICRLICKKINLVRFQSSTVNSFRNENLTQDFYEKLRLIVGNNRLSTSFAVRKQYGTDEGCYEPSPADVVTHPISVDEICKITKLCSDYCVPLIPHGAGTGLELGIGAIMGGVSVDLSLLNSVIELNENDFDCTVEAGITRKTVNEHLKNTGLMFPVDPGADASIGGMVSTSASGTNAVRYGTMKENVLNLEVVLSDGSILHTSGPNTRARKSAAGYNLTELFIGAEGTLGIITKATLRLHAMPEMMISAVCPFKSIHDAVRAVVEILQNSIPIARIELLDELSMAATNQYSNLDYPVCPCLFLEFHGSEDVVKAQAKDVENIVKCNYESSFTWAEDPESRNKLWKARHQIYYATLALKPGYKSVVTDVCVPISNLTEMITKTQEDIRNSKTLGTIIGHVGDGNFHTQLLFDPNNKEQIDTVHALENKIIMRALSLNGTCTGEHGIGIGKINYLEMEYGKVGIQAMASIKKAFDPLNIMNPGKVIRIQ